MFNRLDRLVEKLSKSSKEPASSKVDVMTEISNECYHIMISGMSDKWYSKMMVVLDKIDSILKMLFKSMDVTQTPHMTRMSFIHSQIYSNVEAILKLQSNSRNAKSVFTTKSILEGTVTCQSEL